MLYVVTDKTAASKKTPSYKAREPAVSQTIRYSAHTSGTVEREKKGEKFATQLFCLSVWSAGRHEAPFCLPACLLTDVHVKQFVYTWLENCQASFSPSVSIKPNKQQQSVQPNAVIIISISPFSKQGGTIYLSICT